MRARRKRNRPSPPPQVATNYRLLSANDLFHFAGAILCRRRRRSRRKCSSRRRTATTTPIRSRPLDAEDDGEENVFSRKTFNESYKCVLLAPCWLDVWWLPAAEVRCGNDRNVVQVWRVGTYNFNNSIVAVPPSRLILLLAASQPHYRLGNTYWQSGKLSKRI